LHLWIRLARLAAHRAAASIGDARRATYMPGWLELWVFRQGPQGWSIDPLVPATVEPVLGYVEMAGWTPDGGALLLVREAMDGSLLRHRFQTVQTQTLAVSQEGFSAQSLPIFRRWHTPEWKQGTVALR
jgi:hypothetical protein